MVLISYGNWVYTKVRVVKAAIDSGTHELRSPFLVDTLIALDPPPPNHIHYPSDDVMIGAWVAALKLFPDTSIHFETIPDQYHTGTPLPVKKVNPRPFRPEPLDTTIIDDKVGWANPPGRPDDTATMFGWNSVCVHHVTAAEMYIFRHMEEIRGEWETP